MIFKRVKLYIEASRHVRLVALGSLRQLGRQKAQVRPVHRRKMSGTERRRNEGAAEERREKEGKIDGKEKEDKGGGKGKKDSEKCPYYKKEAIVVGES